MSAAQQVAGSVPSGRREQMEARAGRGAPDQPITVYQAHLPSWMRVPEEQNRPLGNAEIAPKLAAHAQRLQFTHVQLDAPVSRDPAELKSLVEQLRRRGLGVILDQSLAKPGADGLSGDPLLPDGWSAATETHLDDYRYFWDLGWAEETAAYFATDPLYRKFRHGQFRRREAYAFEENFLLPLSHGLVSRPRASLLSAMPGDRWQKFANLRLLFAYQYLLPGKKLMFMGDEFGQVNPWQPETSLDWHLVNEGNEHGQTMRWVENLNRFYRGERALYQTDGRAAGFQWVDLSDATCSVVTFLRKGADGGEVLLAALNFTPVPRHNYRVGVPRGGFWHEVLNSDALEYGGSGQGNLGGIEAAPFGWNFLSHSLMLTLPPLGAVVLKGS